MEYYLGTDLALDSDGDLALERGDLALVNSLDCLIANLHDRVFADKNELLMHPDFGAGLMSSVSLPLSPDHITDIMNLLEHELIAEPRINKILSMSKIHTDRYLHVSVSLETIDHQIIDNLIFPFELEQL